MITIQYVLDSGVLDSECIEHMLFPGSPRSSPIGLCGTVLNKENYRVGYSTKIDIHLFRSNSRACQQCLQEWAVRRSEV